MSDNVEIKVDKITIVIGDQTITLTPKQLKELKNILEETFPEKTVEYIDNTKYVPYIPYVYPNKPYTYYLNTEPPLKYVEPEIWTCDVTKNDNDYNSLKITCKQ